MEDDTEVLYLSSLESRRFAGVFECRVLKRFYFETGKAASVVRLTPSIPGGDFGRGDDISEFVVASRFSEESIDDRTHMPLFVHLAIPPVGWDPEKGPHTAEGFDVVAWVELYRTREDAEQHRIDRRR